MKYAAEAADARDAVHKMAKLWWGDSPAGVVEQALTAAEAQPAAEGLRAAFAALASHPAAQLG